MKPITFESIRNLLKTKKKQKDKSSIDQSFKRSDSFKRISIRKSYLERGRKRNAAAVLRGSTKNLVNINEFEDQAKVVRNPTDKSKPNASEPAVGDYVQGAHEESGLNASGSSSIPKRHLAASSLTPELSFEEKLESNDASLDEKIRALQEINDRYINENRDLIEKTYEVSRKVEKVKIKKPPRPSKQLQQQQLHQPSQLLEVPKKSRENEVQSSDLSGKPVSTGNVPEQRLVVQSSGKHLSAHESSGARGSGRVKNVSHVNINVSSDAIPEEDEAHEGSVRGKSVDDTADDKSFYSISTFTIESNNTLTNNGHHNNTNASSKKSFRGSFTNGTGKSATASSKTITATTTTTATTTELPTLVTIRTYCEPNALMQSTTHVNERYLETSFDSCPEEPVVAGRRDGSLKQALLRVSKDAPPKSPSLAGDVADRQRSPTRIPRINTQTFKMIRSKSRDGIVDEKDLLRRHGSAQNLSVNGSGLAGAGGGDTVELKNQKNKYRKKAKKTSVSSKTGTLDGDATSTFKSHENFDLQRTPKGVSESGVTPNTNGVPEPKFIFPSNYFEEENNIFYDQTLYDEAELPSPENSIPYALRIKENPFTKNKEFYSINTGRIWKQLNLGQQEEDLSILSTPGPRLVPPPKVKNESFKSMSSRDSGFSLTLTKPKNLFRRKSKKATLLQRRKPPKLAVSRDGYFKRVMVVQRNSSKRKKSIRKQRVAGRDIFRELYDENWSKLGDGFGDEVSAAASAAVADGTLEPEAPDFARDFENFCNDRRYNQEIHDLEAFYEEHLKRLRHYYIQKKKMNEAAIKEFYRDYGAGRVAGSGDAAAPGTVAITSGPEVDEENDYYDTFIVTKNETIRFKNNALQQRYFQQTDAGLEFVFPHPDKRKGSSTGPGGKSSKSVKSAGSAGGNHNTGTTASGRKQLFHEVRPYGSPLESLNGGSSAHGHYTEEEFLRSEPSLAAKAIVTRYKEPVVSSMAAFKRSISAPFGDSNFQLTAPGDELKRIRSVGAIQNEISLASIFPSVNGDKASDRHNENEFLINSLGDNLYCVRCDKMNSDCECFEESGDRAMVPCARKDSGEPLASSRLKCKGAKRVLGPNGEVVVVVGEKADEKRTNGENGSEHTNEEEDDEDDDDEEELDQNDENYCDVFDYNDISIIHVNHKKKVKRKKSKKRTVRKNHSTLRRGSYWGKLNMQAHDSTQRCTSVQLFNWMRLQLQRPKEDVPVGWREVEGPPVLNWLPIPATHNVAQHDSVQLHQRHRRRAGELLCDPRYPPVGFSLLSFSVCETVQLANIKNSNKQLTLVRFLFILLLSLPPTKQCTS
ncbi:hypothetical protein ZHAS_00015999 [Anopheles sinensis]|uniref:Uncharacterized protein n=1 Tax=Anopheles sinensis TaxID=74873 RepID=A0A084WCJ3_ANOSI|nr:hypothetical protein ZHAS_00015999 [Anopheles sinensis]